MTGFEILPASGVNVSKIANLSGNIALNLAAQSVRIVAPIPGKRAVGVEIPNQKRNIVGFRELISVKNPDLDKAAVPFILGRDIEGDPQVVDVAKTPPVKPAVLEKLRNSTATSSAPGISKIDFGSSGLRIKHS